MLRPNGSSPLARGTLYDTLLRRAVFRFIPARAGNTSRTWPIGPPRAVHPRSRGEHHSPRLIRAALAGSSPLARGTLQLRPRLPPLDRFIPARAGNTRTRWAPPAFLPVHPRSRGEHGRDLVGRLHVVGSSPLARGTQAELVPGAREVRFIPARAGNTGGVGPRRSRGTVHPRSRGEHHIRAGDAAKLIGSSPLARGTQPVDRAPVREHRFIPARAGNTLPTRPARQAQSVHPRSRGEHWIDRAPAGSSTGSSPLARGTHGNLDSKPVVVRFIPARAGNTIFARGISSVLPVHPRSRGEHPERKRVALPIDGSSPLARGTLEEPDHVGGRERFIPARAGNTIQGPLPPNRVPVHPRSRGEHAIDARRAAGLCGSSPLARGTHRPASTPPRSQRFIPARAGNTTTETGRLT